VVFKDGKKSQVVKRVEAVTAETPQLWKAVHTKIREGNEQAKMGNGWRVLGSGQVHTQNP